jgi:hypothetical protein
MLLFIGQTSNPEQVSATSPSTGGPPVGWELAKRGPAVDWIERLFGVSPDGGSGALELMIAAVVALAVVVAVATRKGRTRLVRRRWRDR